MALQLCKLKMILACLIFKGIGDTSAQSTCEDSLSCAGDEIVESVSSVRCSGYRSCEQASITNSGGHAECFGSYSCRKSVLKQTSSTDSGNMRCYTLSSCSESLITNQYGVVHCSGEQSCTNAKIIILNETSGIECWGDHSCENAQIVASYYGNMYGNLAGLNSQLYGNGSYVHFNVWGFESGYNTTVFCESGSGHTCHINCRGNGCKNLRLNCVDGSGIVNDSLCNLNVNCSYAQYDENNCVYGYVIPSDLDIIEMPSLIETTMTTWENSHLVCNSSNNYVNCVDYQDSQCYGEKIETTVDNPSSVCCTALESCDSAANITTFISSTSKNVSIRCDAYRACRYVPFISSDVNGAGNVYLTSYYAVGWYADDSYNAIIETGPDFDVFCTGANACMFQYIRNGNNLYCTSYRSCISSPLVSNFNTIFAYGANSMQNTTIEDIRNIYCGASESCRQTTINNVLNDVYGNNYKVLYKSGISNVFNNIIGLGYQSMYQSAVFNVTNIYCIGDESCKNSIISAIHNKVQVNGNNALGGSIIISETNFNRNGTLLIFINGTNDDTFDIYCNDTDICKIDCQSSDSCTHLNIHCGSSRPSRCFVKCDPFNGIHCPYGVFNQWTTNTPTAMPTTTPTSNPSVAIEPSSQPSTEPSAEPVREPSKEPTFSPNTFSSIFPTFADRWTTLSGWSSTNSNDDIDDGNDSNNNDSSGSISSNTMIIILVSICLFAFLLCVCMILLFMYCTWYKKVQKEKDKEKEMAFGINRNYKQKEKEKEKEKRKGKGKENFNGSINLVAMYGADGKIIDLQNNPGSNINLTTPVAIHPMAIASDNKKDNKDHKDNKDNKEKHNSEEDLDLDDQLYSEGQNNNYEDGEIETGARETSNGL